MAGAFSSKALNQRRQADPSSNEADRHRGPPSGLVLPRARRIRAVLPLHRGRTVRCDGRAFWLVGLDLALAKTALQLRDSAGIAPVFPRLVTRIRLSGKYRGVGVVPAPIRSPPRSG